MAMNQTSPKFAGHAILYEERLELFVNEPRAIFGVESSVGGVQ